MSRAPDAMRALSVLLLCALVVFACGEKRLRIEEARTGARVSMTGEMEDEGLVYRFPEYRRGGRVRDLFHYIYFQGDTVCFSFAFSRPVARGAVAVRFIDPRSGAEYDAERIEVYKTRVFGFSLVGSLLEGFFKHRLEAPVPRDGFCCSPVPFGLRVLVREDGGATLEREFRGSFRIEYIR